MQRAAALILGAALGGLALAGAMISPGGSSAADGSLVKGWNNVAYLGGSAPPETALAAIDGKYSVVYRWDAEAKAYEVYAPEVPSFASTLETLQSGDAIWLNVTEDDAVLSAASSGSTSGGGVISIAASTFQPSSDLALYEKTFNELHPVGDDEASQRYYAPVTLPNGATITSMTAAFTGSGDTVQIRLDYTPLTNGADGAQVFKLVEVLSSSGSSPQTAQAFAHTVDNTANVYFLIVDLTGGPDSKLHGVSIAYTGG